MGKDPKNTINAKEKGFTFIEMIIAMAILCITLLTIFGMMTSQKKAFKAQDELINMSQNTRGSLDILIRDLRMSGYKVLEDQFIKSLSQWISSEYLPSAPKSVDLDTDRSPILTEGDGTAPDMITVIMADLAENTLLQPIDSGDTSLTFDPNSPGFTGNTKFRVNDIIRLGDHTEFAKITGISGNTISIDTDPSQAGSQGFTQDHPVGEPIREVNIITYTVFNEVNDISCQYHTDEHPVLKRKQNEEGYMEISEDIEDLQIIPHAPPRYKLQLTTRTSSPGDYADMSSDKYKRTKLLADFRVRNYIKPACPVPKTPVITSLSGLNSYAPCTIHVTWSTITTDAGNNPLPPECAVSDYIVTYAAIPETKFYTAYPGTNTSCDIDISAILRDPSYNTYYISLVAVNCSGLSEYTTELTISDSSPPSAVTNLAATAAGHTLTISWIGNPECDVTEYRLYRSTSASGPFDGSSLLNKDFVITLGTAKTYTYQDENLPCNTYYYVVRAFDYTYESNDSNIASAAITDTDYPEKPTDIFFTLAGGNVTLQWTLSTDDPHNISAVDSQGDNDVIKYYIYALNAGSEFLLDNSIPAGQDTATIDAQGYCDFTVKSIDLCGNISY